MKPMYDINSASDDGYIYPGKWHVLMIRILIVVMFPLLALRMMFCVFRRSILYAKDEAGTFSWYIRDTWNPKPMCKHTMMIGECWCPVGTHGKDGGK